MEKYQTSDLSFNELSTTNGGCGACFDLGRAIGQWIKELF